MSEASVIDAVRTPRGIGRIRKGALAHWHSEHLAAIDRKATAECNRADTTDGGDGAWSTSVQHGESTKRRGCRAAPNDRKVIAGACFGGGSRVDDAPGEEDD